jgi:GT2 family glycosyltransferase
VSEQQPLVRVAVVTYNSASVLPGFLDSLPAACEKVRWELVAADNASIDDSLALVASRGYQGTVVRMGRNAGYAAGVNAAARVPGKGAVNGGAFDALLVTNPDVRLDRGAVATLYKSLDLGRTGIAVPRLESEDGHLMPTMRRRPSVLRALGEAVLGGDRAGRVGFLGETVVDPRAYEQEAFPAWASGAVQLIAAGCLEDVGPWDESFLLYSEETDFMLRAGDAGWNLRYVPAARGVHIGGEAHTSPMLWSLLTTNRVRLYARRADPVRAGAFWAAVTLNEGLRALSGRRTSAAAFSALVMPSRRIRSLPDPTRDPHFELAQQSEDGDTQEVLR